jgi:predicted nicotinamide N-methyase
MASIGRDSKSRSFEPSALSIVGRSLRDDGHMSSTSPARLRGFVRGETRLREVPGVPGIRLHQADDVTALWHRIADVLGVSDPPLPYWAFAWSGGLAVVQYLTEHPELVDGRSVLDLGTGSGLCGIVAAKLGAASVRAVDIDPLAAAAAQLNARANAVSVDIELRDLLDDGPPAVDVVLAGDVSYEERMAERMLLWLQTAADAGSLVLLGDPGRRWFDDRAGRGLRRLAQYTVQVSREIEEAERKRSAVYGMDRPLR